MIEVFNIVIYSCGEIYSLTIKNYVINNRRN